MAQITAALVKALRDETGAGMMDAKKALVEANGDKGAAVEWLRAKGLSKAAKKAGRTAADGLVAAIVSEDGRTGVLVELNAETDFVARNEGFQSALRDIAITAMQTNGSVEAVKAAPAPDGEGNVEDYIKRLVAKIGENITLRRTAKVDAPQGRVAAYIHNAETDGMGKVGVLVGLTGDDVAEAGKKVAMHIAATSPAAATIEELDPALIEKEKNFLTEQARESGKPENIIENMIKGRMNKFYKEVVLTEQAFVMDPDLSVGKFIEKAGGALVGFKAFKLGEGIEKEADDFAAEVAALSKN